MSKNTRYLGIHEEGGLTWIPKGKTKIGATIYKTEIICPHCKKKRWIVKGYWKTHLNQKEQFTGVCLNCKRTNIDKKIKEFDWRIKGEYYGAYITCIRCGKTRWIRRNNYMQQKRKGAWSGLCRTCNLLKVRKKKMILEVPKLIDDDQFSSNLAGMGYKV